MNFIMVMHGRSGNRTLLNMDAAFGHEGSRNTALYKVEMAVAEAAQVCESPVDALGIGCSQNRSLVDNDSSLSEYPRRCLDTQPYMIPFQPLYSTLSDTVVSMFLSIPKP